MTLVSNKFKPTTTQQVVETHNANNDYPGQLIDAPSM